MPAPSREHVSRALAALERGQPAAVAAHDGGAPLEPRSRRRQRYATSQRSPLGSRPATPQPLGLPAQRRLGPARETSGSSGGRGRLALGRGRLLEDQVRVGAADAERRHTGPARALAARPRLARVSSRTSPAAQSTCGEGSSACSVRGSCPCRSAMHHLDHARDAGGGLRCGRCWTSRETEPQRARRRAPAVGGQQRLGLDRIAERRARAVRLDRVDVGGRQAGARQRLSGSPAPATGRWARSARSTRRPG